MKKHLLPLLFTFASLQLFSQNGLEDIIVEKYYISDANDASVNDVGGVLPPSSTTYRIYVDMLPGYFLQAIYGVPAHELRIETTTLFFNNEDRGAATPAFSKNQANNNTVMLDSWISVGAACTGNFGVLKSEDDGAATLVNPDGVLQNTNAAAGIPLTEQDGFLLGTPQPITTLGIDAQLLVFDNQNDGTNGPLFSTFDGTWAALSGATGPTASNRVLIAQITTDGILSFKLNVQIGIPEQGIVERYVAENPDTNAGEIQYDLLSFISDDPTKAHFLNTTEQFFTIYPNPADQTISLKTETPVKTSARYSVYNLTGQLVAVKTIHSLTGAQTEHLDISALSKGEYIVEMIFDGKRSTQKFVRK